jgi:SAM-dependent methyltransferase
MTTATHLSPPSPVRHRHRVVAWGNAKFFELMDGYLHRRLGARKQALFADLPPTVAELGAGAGASLRYLSPGTRLLAVEPNPFAHDALRRTAARYGIDLEIREERAEATGIPTASVDAVISTLVLCTVEDQAAALAEVRRILRPGGRFVFIEHVGSGPGPLRALQQLLRRPWRYVFDGCCLDRDTAAAITAAGFADVQIDQFRLGGLFVPVWPQISGVAVAAR